MISALVARACVATLYVATDVVGQPVPPILASYQFQCARDTQVSSDLPIVVASDYLATKVIILQYPDATCLTGCED